MAARRPFVALSTEKTHTGPQRPCASQFIPSCLHTNLPGFRSGARTEIRSRRLKAVARASPLVYSYIYSCPLGCCSCGPGGGDGTPVPTSKGG